MSNVFKMMTEAEIKGELNTLTTSLTQAATLYTKLLTHACGNAYHDKRGDIVTAVLDAVPRDKRGGEGRLVAVGRQFVLQHFPFFAVVKNKLKYSVAAAEKLPADYNITVAMQVALDLGLDTRALRKSKDENAPKKDFDVQKAVDRFINKLDDEGALDEGRSAIAAKLGVKAQVGTGEFTSFADELAVFIERVTANQHKLGPDAGLIMAQLKELAATHCEEALAAA